MSRRPYAGQQRLAGGTFRLEASDEGRLYRVGRDIKSRLRAPQSFLAGLLLVLAVGTPAMAGSASVPLVVSATVVANCRLQNAKPVCTKGSAPLRTEVVPVSAAGPSGAIMVTVNF